MMFFEKEMLCYNCFRKFMPYTVWFRCVNTNEQNHTEECPLVLDKKTKEMQRHAFPVEGWIPKAMTAFRNPLHADCPKTGVRSTRRLCPHCHWELFTGYGELPEFVTAIVGNGRSGKSHYFTVLAQQDLKSPDIGNSVVLFADGPSKEIWNRRYHGPLFRDHIVIPPTRKEEKEKLRIIYQIETPDTKHFNVFFDISGERLQEIGEKEETDETRYLWVSSGIILLINPRDVEDWSPHVDGGFWGGLDPSQVLGGLITELKKNREIKAKAKIPIPLAVCISQFDRFKTAFDLGSIPALSPDLFDPHKGPVREGKALIKIIDAESSVLREFLRRAGPTTANVVNMAEKNFEATRFFAVSALGQSPTADGGVPTVKANRVAAPMFWLMSRLGVVKAN